MTSLGMRRCRPLISPLVAGTKPVHPLDAGPGVHDEDMASRARAPRGWPPGAGRIGARPRNCGSWWAATRLQRPATRLDVSCRVAAPRRGHVVVWQKWCRLRPSRPDLAFSCEIACARKAHKVEG